ncbi:MAG: PKD domain-containing protein, partial [Candidatus Zixiibacteriota bacterium]
MVLSLPDGAPLFFGDTTELTVQARLIDDDLLQEIIPPAEPTLYWQMIDPSGNSVTAVTGVAMAFEVSAAGVYEITVSGMSCEEDRQIAATTTIDIRRSSPPLISLDFVPAAELPFPVGSQVSASFSAVDPDFDSAIQLFWQWGDGSTGSITSEGPGSLFEHVVSHQFGAAGEYTFSLFATDAQGEVAEASAILRPGLTVLPVGKMIFGEAPQFGLALEKSGAPPIMGALGPKTGLVLFSTGQALTTPVLPVRFNPGAGRNATYTGVAADTRRRIVYAATSRDGMYFIDVTNAATPASIFPDRYLPPTPLINLGELSLCPAGDLLFLLNRLDGIYAIELTSDTNLAMARGGTSTSAWSNFVSPANQATFFIKGDSFSHIACLTNTLLLAVSSGDLVVFDLAPFVATGSEPSVAATISLIDTDSTVGVTVHDVSFRTASDGSGWFIDIAAGTDGLQRYFYDTAQKTLSLQAHQIWTEPLLSSEPYDSVEAVWSGPQTTLVAADASGDANDALVGIDFSLWPGATTNTYQYGSTDKCASVGNAQFPHLTSCAAGRLPISFFSGSDTENPYFLEAGNIAQWDTANVRTKFEARGPLADQVLLSRGGALIIDDRTIHSYDFESFAAAGDYFQPAPQTAVTLPPAATVKAVG